MSPAKKYSWGLAALPCGVYYTANRQKGKDRKTNRVADPPFEEWIKIKALLYLKRHILSAS